MGGPSGVAIFPGDVWYWLMGWNESTRKLSAFALRQPHERVVGDVPKLATLPYRCIFANAIGSEDTRARVTAYVIR